MNLECNYAPVSDTMTDLSLCEIINGLSSLQNDRTFYHCGQTKFHAMSTHPSQHVHHVCVSVSCSTTTTNTAGEKVTLIKMHPVVYNEKDSVYYNWALFHWTLALACMFMQNVLTNWAALRASDGGAVPPLIDVGETSSPIWVCQHFPQCSLVPGCCMCYLSDGLCSRYIWHNEKQSA